MRVAIFCRNYKNSCGFLTILPLYENAWIKNLVWEIAFVGKHKNCIGLCMCMECAIMDMNYVYVGTDVGIHDKLMLCEIAFELLDDVKLCST